MKFLVSLLFLFSISAQANNIGHDVQNFNPLTSGLDFVTVNSSETLRPCVINCGVFVNFAQNSLPNFNVPLNASGINEHSDSLISSDVNIGIGLMKRWDVGLSISSVLSQDVDSDVQGIEYENKGLTDLRLNTKIRFLGDYNGGMAVVLGGSLNQTENNPYTGIDNGITWNLELVGDMQINRKIAVAANIGYRVKNSGDPIPIDDLCTTGAGTCPGSGEVIQPFGDSIIGSLAANYLVEDWQTKFIAEVYGSMPADDTANSSDREQTTLEAIIGAKKDFTDKFSAHFGGGAGLIKGSASPDFRLYGGINYALGPLSFCKTAPTVVKIEEGQDPAEAIMVAEDNPPEPIDEPEEIEEPEEDEEVFVIRDVLFDTNKHFLKPEADSTIKDVADKLKRPGGFKSVQVEGHTDSRMPDAYNQALSERRAKSVMKRLIQLGIPKEKITAIGKGELEPIADNGNYQGRALNRRVEFRVRWR